METSAGATAAAATPAVASGVAQHDNANTRMPAVDVDAQAAAQEHVRKSTPFSSLDVVKAEFGRGMFIYFHYVRFVGIANAALALFAALSWLVANADGLLGENRGEESSIHSVLLSAYPKASAPTWYVCTCAMVVIGFAIGPVYRKYQRIYTSNWKGINMEEFARNDKIRLLDKHGAVIQTTSGQRMLRRGVSICIFLVVIVVQGLGTWQLHVALSEASNNTLSLIIAGSITVLNMMYKKLGKWLTTFERHDTWQSYREWDFGKVFTLKITNVMVLYIVKAATVRQSILEKSFCPLASIGTQFFWLIVSDMTVNNAIEVFIPLLTYAIKRRRARGSGRGDNFTKMQFDLAEEYNELLYRQFIIVLGMPVFPFITVMGAAAALLEYVLDKVRLVYLCKVPTFKEEPLRASLVMTASIVVSVCALGSFPNGALWMLSGHNMENCSFFS